MTKIIGYKYNYATTVRLGKYEKAMLNRLVKIWGCSESEAIRRCIVYTFSKYVAKVDNLSEESLLKALRLALNGVITE